MKLITYTCIISFFMMQTIKAQDTLVKPSQYQDTLVKPVQYNVAIKLTKDFHAGVVKGYLATIKDSSLYISQTAVPLSFSNMNVTYLQRVDYKTVNSVKLYNRSKKSTIFLISIFTGIVVGALIGYASGDDTGWFALNAGEKAVVGGLLGAGAGSAVGGIIASGTEKKFLINGEWESLQEMKEGLQNNK
jgi:hypothetical protein